MKTQKEEIEALEKQKESTQGLVCELERQKRKSERWDWENGSGGESCWREEQFFTQEKQITKVGTMIRSLDKNNQKLSKKILRFARQRQEEQRWDRKAFSKLVSKLKAKLGNQIRESVSLKTELNSTVIFFEKTKEQRKVLSKKCPKIGFCNLWTSIT